MFNKIIILSLMWCNCSLFAGEGAIAGGGSAGAGARARDGGRPKPSLEKLDIAKTSDSATNFKDVMVPFKEIFYQNDLKDQALVDMFELKFTRQNIFLLAIFNGMTIEEAKKFLFINMPRPKPSLLDRAGKQGFIDLHDEEYRAALRARQQAALLRKKVAGK